MNPNDEIDYEKADREVLVARLTMAESTLRAVIKGYHALRSHGVDMMSLREWKDTTLYDRARKLKPHLAQPLILEWALRLEHAIRAAVTRKSFRLEIDNTHHDEPTD